MQQHGLVHPGMGAALRANFYPSLCTIQAAATGQDEYGQENGAMGDVAGHIDIPCRLAPVIAPSERRTAQQVYVEGKYSVALNGYYPSILAEMSAVVDGVSYDIEHVGHDGNQSFTQLMVRLVS